MNNNTREEWLKNEMNALTQLLTNTDYKAIKHSEGLISDEDYAATKAQREEWRSLYNEYEKELKTLEG